MSRIKIIPSAIILIVVNLIPILGVLLFDWSIFSIILLYWMENGVIGIFNVMRMAAATTGVGPGFQMTVNNRIVQDVSKISLIGFFIVHYGMFFFVHGIFVFVMFYEETINWAEVALALTLITASHGYSYAVNFIAKGEYTKRNLNQIMMQPYGRVILVHVTILIGGTIAQSLGAPVAALLVMIVLKIVFDLGAHLREHSE